MAGSDAFPPSAGQGRVLPPGDAYEAVKDRTSYDEKPFYEYETPIVLAGVAPEALAGFIAAITKQLGPIAELALVGERPLAHPASARTVDAARVGRWMRGELEGPPRSFATTLPFEVTDRGKKGRILCVSFREMPAAQALKDFDGALTRCHTRFRLEGTGIVSATVSDNTVVWKADVFAGQPYTVDAAAIRAAAMNGLLKLGGVGRVEWSLGVEGNDGSTTAPGKGGKGVLLNDWLRKHGVMLTA
jgi:hypothetical protein